MSLYRAAAVLLFAAVSKAAANAPTLNQGTLYEWNADTAMSDEFDGKDRKWDRQLGQWKGTAPGFFQDSNAVIGGGKLTLTSAPTQDDVPDLDKDCDCGFGGISTGMVVSKVAAQYGFYEIKATLANAQIMSSFWLQGSQGEINIFETILSQGNTPRHSSNHHCFDTTDATQTTNSEKVIKQDLDLSQAHVFGLDWQADKLVYYINGRLARTVDTAGCMNEAMNVILSMETTPKHGTPEGNFAATTQVEYFRRWTRGALKPAYPASCTAGKYAGKAYAGPIIAKYNADHPDGAVTGVEQCAALCAANLECTYYTVNKSPSKGCVLKSKTRGSAVSHANYLGHGRCEHAMPQECKQLGTSEGYHKFKTGQLGTPNKIKNAGACGIKCAANKDCKYWLVHSRLGCVLNTGQKGRLLTGKKGFMFHGDCNVQVLPASGESRSGPAAVQGGLGDTSAGAVLQDNGSDGSSGAESAGSAASVAIGMMAAVFVVAAVVAVALVARKQTTVADAEAQAATRGAQRRGSFDDCIDAVSNSASDDVSMDIVPAVANTIAPLEGPDFEENGFVLTDDQNSIRLKSVHRGNPLAGMLSFSERPSTLSVYSEADVVGPAAIEEDTTM